MDMHDVQLVFLPSLASHPHPPAEN